MENSKRSREAALLVLVVFVLGVLLGGVGAHLWGERVWGHEQSPSHRDRLIRQMTHDVQLTPGQQKQVTAIVDDTRTQVHNLYASLDSQHEQLRQQARARIRAVLTPDQQTKFDDFLRRLDEQRKKEEGH
jgi:Spy/CpxP family protein refolding chaperone